MPYVSGMEGTFARSVLDMVIMIPDALDAVLRRPKELLSLISKKYCRHSASFSLVRRPLHNNGV